MRRPQCWSGMLSSIKEAYFSFVVRRKFSTLPRTAVRLIFFFSRRGRSTQMTRWISLHSKRIRESVMSVHMVADSVGGSGRSSSASSTLSGNCVLKSSTRIPGLGPWASHVRMSRKHIWYQIRRRTWVSTGPMPYSVPSRWSPIHSAIRIAIPTRAECERDTSPRQSGIYHVLGIRWSDQLESIDRAG